MPSPYVHPGPEFNEDTRIEWGLRLPDGNEVWPPEKFYGQDFQGNAGKAVVLAGISDGIRNMGLPFEETLDKYQWVGRIRRVMTTTVADSDLYDIEIDQPDLTEVGREWSPDDSGYVWRRLDGTPATPQDYEDEKLQSMGT